MILLCLYTYPWKYFPFPAILLQQDMSSLYFRFYCDLNHPIFTQADMFQLFPFCRSQISTRILAYFVRILAFQNTLLKRRIFIYFHLEVVKYFTPLSEIEFMPLIMSIVYWDSNFIFISMNHLTKLGNCHHSRSKILCQR